MSILGTGIDICEIGRVKESLEKYGEKFAAKILHPNELNTLKAHRLAERFLAKRFAAKEAFAKALGTGIAQGVTLPAIEVSNDELGKPYILLHGNSAKVCDEKFANCHIHLSISDEKHYAVAQVIIEG